MTTSNYQNSKNNYENWEFIDYTGCCEIHYDPQYDLYWAWYKNDGWGGCDCADSYLGAFEVARDLESTCW